MVDAVLLEWEGVLADTRQARRDALRLALAAEGVAHTPTDDDEQLRGLGLKAAARAVLRHLGSHDATLSDLLVLRAARAFYDTLANGLVLAPGAKAFVESLQSRARIAVVTRAGRPETELALSMAGLEEHVALIVTADDIADDAPSAAAYQHALDCLARVRAVAPWRAAAVVDASPAIRAARIIGLRVIVIGAPAHEAVEADVAVEEVDGVTVDSLVALLESAAGSRPA